MPFRANRDSRNIRGTSSSDWCLLGSSCQSVTPTTPGSAHMSATIRTTVVITLVGSEGGTRTFIEFAATTLFTGAENSNWFPIRFRLRF